MANDDKLHLMSKDRMCFQCPGCGGAHFFDPTRWKWNGSMIAPTITPSLLVDKDRPERRCHSFITDGKIKFLEDCHHELAGKTVEIPTWESSNDG